MWRVTSDGGGQWLSGLSGSLTRDGLHNRFYNTVPFSLNLNDVPTAVPVFKLKPILMTTLVFPHRFIVKGTLGSLKILNYGLFCVVFLQYFVFDLKLNYLFDT